VAIHLAAITDAAGSIDRAEEVERNNFCSTKRIAEACAGLGTRLVTLSSTSVYGTQKEVVDENCAEEDLKPQSPYAATKLKEEKLVRQLVMERGLKAATFRFGTIFGVSPGMRFHTAINKFCWQASMRQPITIWRTAYNQKRPYLDLEDACRAFEHVIRHALFTGEIYNVVTLNATVKDVVEAIRRHIPQMEIQFVDSPIMNQLSYEVSAAKFRNTGFQTVGDLQRSIAEELALIRVA